MALKKRERNLAIATGSLLAVLLLTLLILGGGGRIAQLRTQRNRLQEEVKNKDLKARPGRRALKRVAEWEKRSLPSNTRLVRSLYQGWLRERVVAAKLRNVSVHSSPGDPVPGAYTRFPFTIQAEGTLESLTRFLFDFYSADHLHKIRSMSVVPLEGSNRRELDLTIHIDALSLPGANRKDKLSGTLSKRLARPDLEDYRQAIVDRELEPGRAPVPGGLFVSYEPPPPPREPYRPPPPRPPEPEPPKFDPAKHTYVTAIVSVDGKPQAWLKVRTSGETLRLHEGEEFEISHVRGKVLQIGVREIEVEIEGRGRFVVRDESLSEGNRLPD